MCIGALSVMADALGAIGSGTGKLLLFITHITGRRFLEGRGLLCRVAVKFFQKIVWYIRLVLKLRGVEIRWYLILKNY